MDLIIVPFHDYKKWINEGFRTRDAHLFEHFKKHNDINKILVVNRPVSPVEMILKRSNWHINIGQVIYKEKGCRLTQLSEKVFCLDFFIFDIFKVIREKKYWWFSCFNYPEVISAINKSINLLHLTQTTLFLENPMAIGTAQQINTNLFVFDAIDNWLVHPQMKQIHNIISKNYKYVEEHADIIFTVSENLLHIFKKNNNKFWIPNGVDIEYFSNAIKNERDDKITIGYVGKIQERVDFNLIKLCLDHFPTTEFIFVGPILSQKGKVEKLQSEYQNIKFIGDIHYKNLPSIMKKFDIAIIPHKVDSFTLSMNPLKLYEYLAAGKPVVTTKVAGVNNISSYVYMANDEKEFLNYITLVINSYKNKTINPLNIIRSISEDIKWEHKVDQIVKCIKQNL